MDKGFIRLVPEKTKTHTARPVYVHPRVMEMLKRLPRGLPTKRIFLRDGKPFNEVKRSFKTACKKADIEDFCFHDLRHCANNNLRLAGNDYFRIMAMSGHKTMSVFKRPSQMEEGRAEQGVRLNLLHVNTSAVDILGPSLVSRVWL